MLCATGHVVVVRTQPTFLRASGRNKDGLRERQLLYQREVRETCVTHKYLRSTVARAREGQLCAADGWCKSCVVEK